MVWSSHRWRQLFYNFRLDETVLGSRVEWKNRIDLQEASPAVRCDKSAAEVRFGQALTARSGALRGLDLRVCDKYG